MKYRPPGRLSPRLDPEVVMMLCTAGHVDHGKTALVKLLTGCSTDRLKVEQERGLTIELGFAPCFLGGDQCVGIVDVPGHEKFVKNMVAGVSGIGMTLLVIAADDGLMPQTIEHFQIMDLLGVTHGMIALTKIDLVDEDTVELRKDEIRTFFEGTFLEGAPICPVSSETFVGYPEFYTTLLAEIDEAVKQRVPGVFRMPIERTFSQEGFGSVLTGIPTAGTIAVGDIVELQPGGNRGKVRGIQRFLRDAQTGGCGQCLALNIPDLSKLQPKRGQVICTPEHLEPARFFHLDVQAVVGLEHPIKNAEAIKFHSGTIEASGKIYLLEDKLLDGGGEAVATVALEHPVAAAAHDRVILRRASPATTVAGGEILAVTYGDHRPRKTQILAQLQERREMFRNVAYGSPEALALRMEARLRWETPMGALVEDLARATLLDRESATQSLATLVAQKTAIAITDSFFIHTNRLAALLAEVDGRIAEAKEAKKLNITTNDLRGGTKWPLALWNHVLAILLEKGQVRRHGDVFVIKGALADMPPADRDLMDRIIALYKETGFHSPRPAEISEKLRAGQPHVDKILRHLFAEAEIIRLDKNVVLHYDVFRKAQDLVVEAIQKNGVLVSSDFKDLIGSTRKYAIAILDYLDGKRVTIRFGNDRKLTQGYEKNLL